MSSTKTTETRATETHATETRATETHATETRATETHATETHATKTRVTDARPVECNRDNSKGISICIPRVFNNIGWRRIKRIFIDLHWGFVDRVDVIPLGNFKRAFVHFAPGKWNMRDHAEVLTLLLAGEEVKIVYDEPWFWKLSISRSPKPTESPTPHARARVYGRKKVIDISPAKPENTSVKLLPDLLKICLDAYKLKPVEILNYKEIFPNEVNQLSD
jgi:hypothetical protein